LAEKPSVLIGTKKIDMGIVGKVLLNNQDINFKIVNAGLAWHYKKYQKEQSRSDRKRYSDAEKVAKLSVIGLWQEPDAIPPWKWRKGTRPVRLNQKQKIRHNSAEKVSKSTQ